MECNIERKTVKSTDGKVGPRNGVLSVGHKNQRQQLVENLEWEKDADNRESEIPNCNSYDAYCGNCQIQAGENPSRRRVRPEDFIESRERTIQRKSNYNPHIPCNKHIHEQ